MGGRLTLRVQYRAGKERVRGPDPEECPAKGAERRRGGRLTRRVQCRARQKARTGADPEGAMPSSEGGAGPTEKYEGWP